MSAPSIPNLLSLRGGRGGSRGRGRAPGAGGHPQSSQARHDATIQGTDVDAAVSRLSAVELGYMDDPYAPFFVQDQSLSRRLPIINRGTYTRTMALDRLIDSYLSVDFAHDGDMRGRQIISLGAGTDTRCFRLFSQKNRRRPLIYHEIDFPSTINRKRMIVQTAPLLKKILPDPVPVEEGSTTGSWRSIPEGDGNRYWCHALDLRDLAKEPQSGQESESCQNDLVNGLRVDVPTLLISECCLCYLETPEAKKVIKYFADRIPDLGLVLYEPVHPEDPFGRQMVSNLASRKIKMPTLEDYKDPRDQEERLRQAGFTMVEQKTVDKLWERWVSTGEKGRLDNLEGLDEVEEWHLLAAHYIVAWGCRGKGFDGWLTLNCPK